MTAAGAPVAGESSTSQPTTDNWTKGTNFSVLICNYSVRIPMPDNLVYMLHAILSVTLNWIHKSTFANAAFFKLWNCPFLKLVQSLTGYQNKPLITEACHCRDPWLSLLYNANWREILCGSKFSDHENRGHTVPLHAACIFCALTTGFMPLSWKIGGSSKNSWEDEIYETKKKRKC